MSASLSGVFNIQEFTDLGVLGAGMRLYTYVPATTTQKAAYTDAAGAIPHTYTNDGLGGQYLALNSRGELPAPLFLTAGGYDLTLKTAAGVTVWTRRAVGANDKADTLDAALRSDLADASSATKGAAMVGFNPTLNYAVATIGQRLKEAISPTSYPWLAKFDGATDDGAAINACLTHAATNKLPVDFPAGIASTSVTITIPTGVHVNGAGSGGYIALTGASAGATIIEKTNGDTGGDTIITVGEAAQLSGIQVRPSNYAAVTYSLADYPGGTGNTSYGVRMLESAKARDVTAIALSVAGFFSPVNNATTGYDRCHAFNSNRGYLLESTDGLMQGCVAMFCHQAGIDASGGGAFWQFVGNRIEWNARYGLIAGAENCGSANVFDRNGWAGLYLYDGNWGQVWTGNYFSRNGVGGDPTQGGGAGLGRWGFSVSGDPSFVTTALADSCHIKFGYQRGMVLSGNRFRRGTSDALDGADGPACIYNCTGAAGSTGVDDVRIFSNAGDQRDSQAGFNSAAYTSTGVIATGTDTTMVGYLVTGWALGPNVLQVNVLRSLTPVGAASSSMVIPLPKGTGGVVTIFARSAALAMTTEIYYAENGVGAGFTTSVQNRIGAAVSTAVLTSGTAPWNTLTITFAASYFATYVVTAA